MRQVDFDCPHEINKVWIKETIKGKRYSLDDLHALRNDATIYFCKKICVDDDYVYLYDVLSKRTYTPQLPVGYTLIAHEYPGDYPFHGSLASGYGPNKDISVDFGKVIPLIVIPKDHLCKISSHTDMTEVPKVLLKTEEKAKAEAQGKVIPLPPSRIWNIKVWDDVVKLAKENYTERQRRKTERKYLEEYSNLSTWEKFWFELKLFFTGPGSIENPDIREAHDHYVLKKMKNFKVDYTSFEEYFQDLKKNGVNKLIKAKKNKE